MEQNCLEQTLNDVVRVELVLASACDFAVPFRVPGIVSMAGTKTVDGETVDRIGAATLALAYEPGASDHGEMDAAPSLSQSVNRKSAGIIVTHELQVPIVGGFEDVRTAVNVLNTKNFNVVLTTVSGTRYLLYTLPNSCVVSLDETDVNQQSTVKVQVLSMSHVIRLE